MNNSWQHGAVHATFPLNQEFKVKGQVIHRTHHASIVGVGKTDGFVFLQNLAAYRLAERFFSQNTLQKVSEQVIKLVD